MKKIALISDTHGDFPERIFELFKEVDEIWHAGDIGDLKVTDELSEFKTLRAVYGNIDDHLARRTFKEHEVFTIEGLKVVITHIGGKPGKYSTPALALLKEHQPHIFICGHSHILLVQKDERFNTLWLNPGACGSKGFHKVKTALRFTLNEGKIENLEAIEFGKRGEIQ